MRLVAVLGLLAALVAGGCGDDGRQTGEGTGSTGRGTSGGTGNGLKLSVSFPKPLPAGGPVTWTLEVVNHGPEAVTLVFQSGKEGDVALVRDGREAYRWSDTRFFTQAIRQVRLGAGESRRFTLEEKSLPVTPGDYELVAELASEPAPPPARMPVSVE